MHGSRAAAVAASPAGLKAPHHALPEVMLAGIRGRNEEEAAAKGQLTVGGNWSGGRAAGDKDDVKEGESTTGESQSENYENKSKKGAFGAQI